MFKKKILKFKYTFYCQTHIQTQTPLKNVAKPNSVHRKILNGIVAEFCYILMTADRHTVCWKWEENQNIFFCTCTFWNSFRHFLVLLDLTLTHLHSEFWGSDIPQRPKSFEIFIQLGYLEKKTFQSTSGPTRWLSSVQVH